MRTSHAEYLNVPPNRSLYPKSGSFQNERGLTKTRMRHSKITCSANIIVDLEPSLKGFFPSFGCQAKLFVLKPINHQRFFMKPCAANHANPTFDRAGSRQREACLEGCRSCCVSIVFWRDLVGYGRSWCLDQPCSIPILFRLEFSGTKQIIPCSRVPWAHFLHPLPQVLGLPRGTSKSVAGRLREDTFFGIQASRITGQPWITWAEDILFVLMRNS